MQDVSTRNVPALLVFSMSLKYLKDALVSTLTERGTGVDMGDIKFILTIPAIWTDSAKQFMREASVMVSL